MKLIQTQKEKSRGESGVVTAEFVAVTATAVVIAMTLAWVVLRDALTDSAGVIATELLAFINEAFP